VPSVVRGMWSSEETRSPCGALHARQRIVVQQEFGSAPQRVFVALRRAESNDLRGWGAAEGCVAGSVRKMTDHVSLPRTVPFGTENVGLREHTADSPNVGDVRIGWQRDMANFEIAKEAAKPGYVWRLPLWSSPGILEWFAKGQRSFEFANPMQHRPSLVHDLGLASDIGTDRGQQRDCDHQRSQAELEAAAWASLIGHRAILTDISRAARMSNRSPQGASEFLALYELQSRIPAIASWKDASY
jgi:hypothetical protein